MDSANFQSARGYGLDAPGHPQGVSCDENGPAMGPIRFLVKTAAGFVPRPIEELNVVLSRTFDQPIDCTDLWPRLRAVARALDAGNLPRAMIATQLLRLPVLSKAEARRAAALAKAAPDDPRHPGWPGGTEGGLGGKFRPKEGGADPKIVADQVRRLIKRRALRTALRRLLTFRRLGRIAGEIASNAFPGADIAGDAALIIDVSSAIEEAQLVKADADAALDFVNGGPRDLDELRVTPQDEAFSSFDAFKKDELAKRFGPAGDGYEYHHIVEQSAGGDIPDSLLQSVRNIVRIPKLLHEEISSIFSKAKTPGGPSLRTSLKGQPFEVQWEAGLRAMREIGIIP
jgi:hypothetical protein